MNIVIEGIDASGKSSLAQVLAAGLGMEIIESEGPEKEPGELNARVNRYFQHHQAIFVRHPCVSDPIYSKGRGRASAIADHLIDRFYTQRNLFVYCDPLKRGLKGHIIKKAVDTDAHTKMLADNYGMLLTAYRDWALYHAHILYRIGDGADRIGQLIQGVLNDES